MLLSFDPLFWGFIWSIFKPRTYIQGSHNWCVIVCNIYIYKICIYIYIIICIYIYLSIYIYMYLYVWYVFVCIYIYLYAFICIYMYFYVLYLHVLYTYYIYTHALVHVCRLVRVRWNLYPIEVGCEQSQIERRTTEDEAKIRSQGVEVGTVGTWGRDQTTRMVIE